MMYSVLFITRDRHDAYKSLCQQKEHPSTTRPRVRTHIVRCRHNMRWSPITLDWSAAVWCTWAGQMDPLPNVCLCERRTLFYV